MANSIDDIALQARQGSVAAIIQVLNEKLAHSGVRTRAVLDNGVLQLLCEALEPEQLEQSTVVERIRQILESLAPRNIRRVKINSRIVREQQLLWLEEISREPQKHLLWFQEIILTKPNILKRLVEDIKTMSAPKAEPSLPKQAASSRFEREQRQFWRGILVGGATLSLLLLLLGLVFTYSQLPKIGQPSSATRDNFVEAVRLAEQASADGRKAQSPADWLKLAAIWQQASELMDDVPLNDPRYNTARDRSAFYRKNSEDTQQKAEKMRSKL